MSAGNLAENDSRSWLNSNQGLRHIPLHQ